MTNITFKLQKHNKGLIYQVLGQTDLWQKSRDRQDDLEFTATNGFKVISCCEPHILIDNKIIYIRGSFRDRNNQQELVCIDSIEKRDEYYNLIIETLKQWSQYVTELNRDKNDIFEL